MERFDPNDFSQDIPVEEADFREVLLETEVPSRLEQWPDGREMLIIGDPQGDKAFTHRQGDNPFGFEGTCGLCSCENVLRAFGLEVTEADVVAFAVKEGLCQVSDDPARSGGTTVFRQAELLSRLGVPSNATLGGTLDGLASDLEEGKGVIVELNAGVLWDRADFVEEGQANHAVTVTGVARDPQTGNIEGFFINDSGTGKAGQFVDASTMREAWVESGGQQVTTLLSRTNMG